MKYIPALDGLRAFAVIAVIAHHIFPEILSGGFIGVDVFFVLSGFLITRLFIIERESTGTIDLPKFFIRRALRLMPAFWLMVSVFLIVALITHDRSRFERDLIDALFAVTYTTNFALGILTPAAHGLFDNAWSLAVEEQFYIWWGIGAFVLLRFTSRHVAALVLGASAVFIYAWRLHLLSNGAALMRIYVGFDTRADELLIGCLGAALLPTSLAATSSWIRYGGLAALTGLIAIAFYGRAYYLGPDAEQMNFAIVMTVVTFLTIIVIFDLMTNADGLISQVLSSRQLVYIGSISYGMYLWHWPLLVMAKESGFDGPLKKAFIVICVTFTAAALSYHYVERPIRGLKRRFAPRPISQKKLETIPSV
jgi:peptidoglycan/LPS O-acetylase OafA/YrhL